MHDLFTQTDVTQKFLNTFPIFIFVYIIMIHIWFGCFKIKLYYYIIYSRQLVNRSAVYRLEKIIIVIVNTNLYSLSIFSLYVFLNFPSLSFIFKLLLILSIYIIVYLFISKRCVTVSAWTMRHRGTRVQTGETTRKMAKILAAFHLLEIKVETN